MLKMVKYEKTVIFLSFEFKSETNVTADFGANRYDVKEKIILNFVRYMV